MPPEPPYRALDRTRPYQGKLVSVRVDHLASPSGETTTREVVEARGAVAGLAVDEQGRVLLVEQWRNAPGGRLVEIAAGQYDVDGEAVEAALRRELAEELGVGGGTATWLASVHTTPGWSDEVVDLFLVEGVRPLSPRERGKVAKGVWEEAELRVLRLGLEEAMALAATPPGDAKTLLALALYGLKHAGVWTSDQAGRPAPDAPARRAAARPG
ncbi:MAG TPA: NUDIX hydrolase [Actinomycetota bacterium]